MFLSLKKCRLYPVTTTNLLVTDSARDRIDRIVTNIQGRSLLLIRDYYKLLHDLVCCYRT